MTMNTGVCVRDVLQAWHRNGSLYNRRLQLSRTPACGLWYTGLSYVVEIVYKAHLQAEELQLGPEASLQHDVFEVLL